jgi:putative cell wall-binding protein
MLGRSRIPTFVALVALAGGASASFDDPAATGPTHEIVFPVVGGVTWTDTFGAPRGADRVHEGQDLMGTKMQPLVAAADGVVSFITIPQASYGYMVRVAGDDGWVYSYLHLNNDTPGTDDGQADLEDVFAPGIARGGRVVAGQLLAFMGDSGNAESTSPHLHFEMRDPDGLVVNAAAALEAARVLDAAIDPYAGLPDIERLAGTDRIGTAVEASRAGWDRAEHVVLAAGDRYAEALPASVLAASVEGPLLLSAGAGLPDEVADELRRLEATKVTVVGGVPDAVDAALVDLGIAVTRIDGRDRYAVAAAIARAVGGGAKTAIVVNADRFPDGISGAGLGAGRGWPILLATVDRVPQITIDTIRALGVTKTYLVGGTAVLNDAVARVFPGSARIAGADRYATSVAAVQESLDAGVRSLEKLYAATGTAYPDALAAGALAARVDGVVLLVDGIGNGGDGASAEWLDDQSRDITLAGVLGGYQAVGPIALRTLGDLLGL